MSPASTHSFKAAKKLTAHHAKSFYFSSFPLPLKKRHGAYAIYAFCRFADDLVDEGINLSVLPESCFEDRIGLLQQILNFAYVTSKNPIEPCDLPWLRAFRETVQDFQIPRGLFEDLLTGLRMDLSFEGIKDGAHLSRYCYHVAGVVGVIMTKIFQMDSNHNSEAIALGEAMQLSNIIRDIREDYSLRQRIYVPQNLMFNMGLAIEDFANLASDRASLEDAQKIWPVVEQLIGAAKLRYSMAEPGLKAIPADGSRFCAELMLHTYRGILEKVEKRGSPALFERQKLSFFRKLEKIPVAIYRQSFSQS